MNCAFSAAMVWLNGFSEGFCSGGVLTVEAESAGGGRSTMGTSSSLQNEVALLALALCPAGRPTTTPGTGMLPEAAAAT
jgi:hypothetical protein